MKERDCMPAVKEYTHRIVEDIEHKTVLYFARYVYTGISKGTTFSTIDDDYICSTKTTFLDFSYLLTYESGISKDMFHIVGRTIRDSNFSPPLLPTVEKYICSNSCIDEETLQKIWFEQTKLYSKLLEAQIEHSRCNRLTRIDHSQNICKTLMGFNSNRSKEQCSSVRILLLV
ncbi:Hypothetical protein PHPALM_14739 [Phytophthora palmivora]|uniref:Uncharacterized protein n=1 Tax=Phytophthora palmivora TaxID=4796 RepID=A0A2P4XTY3_9STRA|nr:Hypothetical protein PHPALM_14739 [Phytophthora palmivora]